MNIKPYFKTKEYRLYKCDNLELLKELPDKYIDLIYCDILYGTGRKFKDYDDNLGTPQEAMKWYQPRLVEMRRTLKDTGSIYLQCDYRLVHYLKVKMDDIFEYKNFKNEIIWHYKSMSNTKKYFPRKHDTILFYTKTNNYTFNKDNNAVQIPYSEGTIKRSKTKAGFSNDKADYLKSKTYLTEDVWSDISFLKAGVTYNTQKPKKLLERIIQASSNKGDIIADFFCGSGTTGVVAKELNRRSILCDINLKAIEISNDRLNKKLK